MAQFGRFILRSVSHCRFLLLRRGRRHGIPAISSNCCNSALLPPSQVFRSETASLQTLARHHCKAAPSEPTPLSTQGPYASRLPRRGVLRFEGPDTFRFLQGLVTNDVSRFTQEPPPPMAALPTLNRPVAFSAPLYTAILSPQGRFLFDLFFYRPVHPSEKLDRFGSGPGSDSKNVPALLADVDATALEELLVHLKKYRLRAHVEIEDVSKDLSVWQRFGGPLDDGAVNADVEGGSIGWGGSPDPSGRTAAESNANGWCWFKDPRCGVLGFRGLFSSDTVPPSVEADKEVDEEYYLLWRIEQGVAEGCTEIPKGEAMPLEYNLAGLNAINFEKGCYVGQELIARTHHRGIIRKRLMPLKFVHENGEEAQQEVAPKAEITDANSGKKLGIVTTVLGPRGLGLIRLEASPKDASQLLVKDSDRIYVKVSRPKWWPSKWGREEEQHAAAA